jgi:hypothetical protein
MQHLDEENPVLISSRVLRAHLAELVPAFDRLEQVVR